MTGFSMYDNNSGSGVSTIEQMAARAEAQRRESQRMGRADLPRAGADSDMSNIQPQNFAPAIAEHGQGPQSGLGIEDFATLLQATPTPTPQGNSIADFAARMQMRPSPTPTPSPAVQGGPLTPEHHAALQELMRPHTSGPLTPVSGPSPLMQQMLDAQSKLDAREAEYNKAPEQFEANRMAQPPTSGELRYSIGGGPTKSYNVGANRTDVAGDPAFAPFRQDRVFGQERTTPAGAGGVSTPGGTDDAAREAYLRNMGGDAEVDRDLAEQALGRKLAANPFAKEDAERDRQIAVVRAQAQATQDTRRAANRFDAQRDVVIADAQRTAAAIDSAARAGKMTKEEAARRHDLLQRRAGQYLYQLEQARADEEARKNAGSVFGAVE